MKERRGKTGDREGESEAEEPGEGDGGAGAEVPEAAFSKCSSSVRITRLDFSCLSTPSPKNPGQEPSRLPKC